MNKVGVMQGRLLQKYQGRYQAHPLGYWQDEFVVAKEEGLDCIEFILDFNAAYSNPLLSPTGGEEIKRVSEQTGIQVHSVCADYFMEAPLHSEDMSVVEQSTETMRKLLKRAGELGVSDVVIPCVDQSSLVSQAAADRFVERLVPLVSIADEKEINLSLETDLAPQSFAELLDQFDSDRVTVNYDIGNSAALGYSPVEELDAYGSRITDIHIKDRVRGGGPVVLGEGDVDFNLFFTKLKEFDYQGPFIMQAYRDEEGIEIFRRQLTWIKPYLERI